MTTPPPPDLAAWARAARSAASVLRLEAIRCREAGGESVARLHELHADILEALATHLETASRMEGQRPDFAADWTHTFDVAIQQKCRAEAAEAERDRLAERVELLDSAVRELLGALHECWPTPGGPNDDFDDDPSVKLARAALTPPGGPHER